MESTGDQKTGNSEAVPEDTGATAEPDEQVALDRLTAAFAELLGSDQPPAEPADVETTDVEPADVETTDVETTESRAEPDDPPASDPALPATDAPAVVSMAEPGAESGEPPCPISPQAILEAMLFVGDPQNHPISPRQAAARLRGVSPREVESHVEELNEKYRAEGCPYMIESSGEGYRMVLREQFESVRERFYGRIREARLSQAAIDILALIAYHQPISRNRIDEIRGKPGGAILSQLVRRQLLRIERTDTKPRVTRYRTTERFLELFGLEDLDDLPHTQDLDKNL